MTMWYTIADEAYLRQQIAKTGEAARVDWDAALRLSETVKSDVESDPAAERDRIWQLIVQAAQG